MSGALSEHRRDTRVLYWRVLTSSQAVAAAFATLLNYTVHYIYVHRYGNACVNRIPLESHGHGNVRMASNGNGN